jgi:DNA invertase Pin-like site-specific DNA recombinase
MVEKHNSTKAVAYLRTSSAANTGPDGDSSTRQRLAIAAYAARAGYTLVDEYNDEAVSGADPIASRPGFAKLLDRIESNGVRVVLVEDASRFARELMTQELGILTLVERGVQVLTANGDNLTDTTDPSRTMMRQIAGSFHQYEKARLVAKLKGARDRKRALTGKCGGRKTHAELNPAVVALAKQLRRKRPKGGQRSLREIAAELAAQGHLNRHGNTYSAASIAAMVEG